MFIQKSHELEYSAEVENFPLWRMFFFRHLDHRVCKISDQMSDVEIIPHWWKILGIFLFIELHEVGHSAEATFFQ